LSHRAESTSRDSVTAEEGPQSRNVLFIDLYATKLAHYPSKLRYKVDQINLNSQKPLKYPLIKQSNSPTNWSLCKKSRKPLKHWKAAVGLCIYSWHWSTSQCFLVKLLESVTDWEVPTTTMNVHAILHWHNPIHKWGIAAAMQPLPWMGHLNGVFPLTCAYRERAQQEYNWLIQLGRHTVKRPCTLAWIHNSQWSDVNSDTASRSWRWDIPVVLPYKQSSLDLILHIHVIRLWHSAGHTYKKGTELCGTVTRSVVGTIPMFRTACSQQFP